MNLDRMHWQKSVQVKGLDYLECMYECTFCSYQARIQKSIDYEQNWIYIIWWGKSKLQQSNYERYAISDKVLTFKSSPKWHSQSPLFCSVHSSGIESLPVVLGGCAFVMGSKINGSKPKRDAKIMTGNAIDNLNRGSWKELYDRVCHYSYCMCVSVMCM